MPGFSGTSWPYYDVAYQTDTGMISLLSLSSRDVLWSISEKKERKEWINEWRSHFDWPITPHPPSLPLPQKKRNYWSVRNAPFRLQQGDVSLGVSWTRESLSIDFWSIWAVQVMSLTRLLCLEACYAWKLLLVLSHAVGHVVDNRVSITGLKCA